MNWSEKLPKIELHVHLEGAIPHNAFDELLKKYGQCSIQTKSKLLQLAENITDFKQFIEVWTWKNLFLREYEDFTFISQAVANNMVFQNIRYAEVFFSPSSFALGGMDIQEIAYSIRKGFSTIPEIEINMIADLVRDYGPHHEMETLLKLCEVKGLGITGIGLGGSENPYPPELFQAVFEKAHQEGFFTTIHAAEDAGPQNVWCALEKLHADRIGHGNRIIEDPELMNYMADNKIPIELCISSNVFTNKIPRFQDHPVRIYFEKGIPISINTDDPAFFNTTLSREYDLLIDLCKFSKKEVCRILLSTIQSSWLPENKKALLRDQFVKDPCWEELGITDDIQHEKPY